MQIMFFCYVVVVCGYGGIRPAVAFFCRKVEVDESTCAPMFAAAAEAPGHR
jgi:hypothetical protein